MSDTGYTGIGVILAFHEGGLQTFPYYGERESPQDAARRTLDHIGRSSATVAVTLGGRVWAWTWAHELIASETYTVATPALATT